MDSLRNNRSLLKHKPLFRKGGGAFEPQAFEETADGAVDCTPASEATLLRIRTTMQRQRKRQGWMLVIAAAVLIAISAVVVANGYASGFTTVHALHL